MGEPDPPDGLLLDDEGRRQHAQVTADRPFGVPGMTRPRSLLRASFVAAVGVLLALGLAKAIVAVASELLLIVVAGFIAVGLQPVVDWLARHGLRRGLAVTLLAVVLVGLLAALLAAAVPPLVSEFSGLVSQAPGYVQQLQDKHTLVGRINNTLHLESKLQSLASSSFALASVSSLLSAGRTVVSYTFQTLVVVVLVIYFLADFPNIKRAFYRLVPLERRPRVGLLGDEIIARTGGYLLGNVFTSLIAAATQFVVLRALGVPFALVLSVLVGVFDLIPLVGSTLAGVIVTLVAFATVSPTAALINIGFTVVYRLVEDYVISPRVLRRTVEVRPAVTIIAVLLGGALLGAEGALIGVPVAAAIQLIITEVVYPHTDRASSPP